MDGINKNDSHLRAKLFDLIEEQEKWQRMKDEAMGSDTIDVLRGKIMSIKKTIAHHEDIIERCHKAGKMCLSPQKTEHSWYYNSPEYIPYDERDDWDEEYVIYGGDMYFPELVVSVKHSEKRVSIWQEEVTKLEQRVIKITIAQEQLAQLNKEISETNLQIQKLNNPHEQENIANKMVNPSTNISKIIRVDKLDYKTCKETFDDIIAYSSQNRGKQQCLRGLLDHPTMFNMTELNHSEIALELNKMQNKHKFKKEDVDTACKSYNREMKK